MARATQGQKAERLNLARTLLRRYDYGPEAAQQLARTCSISPRQAYRYLEQAQHLKAPVPVGRGPQGCLYGQAFSPPRATPAEICLLDRGDLKRDRQPSAARSAGPWRRTWLINGRAG